MPSPSCTNPLAFRRCAMSDPAPQHPGPAPAVIILPPPGALTAAKEKKPRRRRTHVKRCRFDDAELAEFEARARASGLSEGAYNRQCTIGDAGPRAKRSPPTFDGKLVARLNAELNHIGSNLNQVTRGLNQLCLVAREMDADRLEQILTGALEQNRTLAGELARTLAASRTALGYDSQG